MIEQWIDNIYINCGIIGLVTGVVGSFLYNSIIHICCKKKKEEPKNVIIQLKKDE